MGRMMKYWMQQKWDTTLGPHDHDLIILPPYSFSPYCSAMVLSRPFFFEPGTCYFVILWLWRTKGVQRP